MQAINNGGIPPIINTKAEPTPKKNKFQIGEWVKHKSDNRYNKLLVVDFNIHTFDKTTCSYIRWLDGKEVKYERTFLNVFLERI